MSESRRPSQRADSRKPKVAAFASVASVAYAASLLLQRLFPSLRGLLEVRLEGGIVATYYLRVLTSLVLGAVAAALAPLRPIDERWLAWTTAIAMSLAVVAICAAP